MITYPHRHMSRKRLMITNGVPNRIIIQLLAIIISPRVPGVPVRRAYMEMAAVIRKGNAAKSKRMKERSRAFFKVM